MVELHQNELKLPTMDEMKQSIQQEKEWKVWMKESSRASTIQLHMIKYHDILCNDMKVKIKKKNLLNELFYPYCASDYSSLVNYNSVQ